MIPHTKSEQTPPTSHTNRRSPKQQRAFLPLRPCRTSVLQYQHNVCEFSPLQFSNWRCVCFPSSYNTSSLLETMVPYTLIPRSLYIRLPRSILAVHSPISSAPPSTSNTIFYSSTSSTTNDGQLHTIQLLILRHWATYRPSSNCKTCQGTLKGFLPKYARFTE